MSRTAKLARAALVLLAVVFLYGELLMPRAWKWGASNLQIHLHNTPDARTNTGWIDQSVGWSKLSVFLGDWWRLGNDHWYNSRINVTDRLNVRITSITPSGVWVRLLYEQTINGERSAFDTDLFVTPGRTALTEVDGIVITGQFE